MMVIFTTNVVPFEWQIPGYQWALNIPLSLVVGCHILLPVRSTAIGNVGFADWFLLQIVLNPWLMIFSF